MRVFEFCGSLRGGGAGVVFLPFFLSFFRFFFFSLGGGLVGMGVMGMDVCVLLVGMGWRGQWGGGGIEAGGCLCAGSKADE